MTRNHVSNASITAVILAGGEARRMGGQDKGLIELGGRPMIEYVLDNLKPQVSGIIINANRNHDIYRGYGYPVIADERSGYHGPLAGMASCMQVIETALMLTVPCDSPYLPTDLVARLYMKLLEDAADISVAHTGERMQPVFSLLKRSLYDSLRAYLDQGERKIDKWYAKHALTTVDFSDKPETFININSPEDIINIKPGLISSG